MGKLIYLYDNNHISLAACTDLTFTEDCAKRFESYGWHTQMVEDGNDLKAIDEALRAARMSRSAVARSGAHAHRLRLAGKQDTFEAHGAPLGEEEVKRTKQKLGWPAAAFCSPDVMTCFRESVGKEKKPRRNGTGYFSLMRKNFLTWPS